MRKNQKMTKDELKALREARANAMNESLAMLGLETETKRAQYAETCDVSASALLVASVDENGFILTSTNAVRYKAQDTGEGTLFLDGGKDIYLRKDFLEAQGYNAEDGWPVALRVTMSFPTLLADEQPAEKKPRKAGRRTRKAQELTHTDVDNMAVKAGLADEAGVEQNAGKRGNKAVKRIVKLAGDKITAMDTPKKPWKSNSAKARGLIKAQVAELTDMGVPEDDARKIVVGILVKKGYIVEV